MKKTFFTLILALVSIFAQSQTYYQATKTELYTYNETSKDWELYQKMSDVKINVVVEEEFVSFQAKTPSFYRIYTGSKEEIKAKTFKGYRYNALDLKTNQNCYIDICKFGDTNFMISIVKSGELNLRYYLTIE